MIILIGSKALLHRAPDAKHRKFNEMEYDVIIDSKKDFDSIVVPEKTVKLKESSLYPGKFKYEDTDGYTWEIDFTKNESNKILVDLICRYTLGNFQFFSGLQMFVPNKQLLYLTKRAHANYAVNFEKTLNDICYMQENKWDEMEVHGNTPDYLEDDIFEYYFERKDEAKERFGKIQNRINLNKPNEEFFKGGMDLRTYDHDDLHKAVAFFPDFPMYLRCKWDWDSAKIDMGLFDRLHPDMQMMMAQEEAMVIALERFWIPDKIRKPKSAYMMGLLKLVKDLCKGKFQDYMLDNIYKLTKLDVDYTEKFNAALNAGKISLKKE